MKQLVRVLLYIVLAALFLFPAAVRSQVRRGEVLAQNDQEALDRWQRMTPKEKQELRERYQGVRPPTPRGEDFFDPGAKYHVPANTPYARYFLASVLQFQFHRALAKEAGCTTPLHRCSIYDNKEAGERLKKALAMGASKPWPDVLEVLTGQREMDASAIADYFAPLKTWLDEQNQGRKIGWQ